MWECCAGVSNIPMATGPGMGRGHPGDGLGASDTRRSVLSTTARLLSSYEPGVCSAPAGVQWNPAALTGAPAPVPLQMRKPRLREPAWPCLRPGRGRAGTRAQA